MTSEARAGEDTAMDDNQISSNRMQNGMRDARTHVNRQKTRRDIEPPRTVREQIAELTIEVDGVRKRDPVGAAQAQHTHRDNGVGGAWIDTAQRANDDPELGDETFYEKLPDRHAERSSR
jgi:hypothetical protein